MKQILAMLAVLFAVSTPIRSQSAPSRKQSSTSTDTNAAKPELQDVRRDTAAAGSTLNLKAAGPLNPEEAARATAKSLARQKGSPSGSESKGSKEKPDQRKAVGADGDLANDAVVEFRPATNGSERSSGAAAVVQKQGRSPLKQVHGELYGAKSGVGHADGGSVGATSKSGKTSVHVGSSQSQSAISQPQ